MDSRWQRRLEDRLVDLGARSLRRSLPPRAASHSIDLRTNDYLALRDHARIREAAARAACEHPAGAGASRLITPPAPPVEQLERRFTRFKSPHRAARSLLLPTGYTANLALLTALPEPGDLILADKLCHASIIDGARLATTIHSGLTFRTFPHLDLDRAGELARRAAASNPDSTCYLVTDSVFSMDGDCADLPALAALRDELAGAFNGGACLITDEAHATGVLGDTGAGLDEAAGHAADVTVSTASKALGCLGGIITGPPVAIDAVVNLARPFIYTTGVPAAQTAAIDAALDVLRDEPERRARLHGLVRACRDALAAKGWDVPDEGAPPTPILPLVVGDEERALALSRDLAARGILAPAIRPPTVKPGSARLRLSLHAGLADQDLSRVLDAIPNRRD